MTLPKVGDLYNGGLWGNTKSFVISKLNLISGYIKNVDAYHVSFSWIKQIIKQLLSKSIWQTNMKCTVVLNQQYGQESQILKGNKDVLMQKACFCAYM